MSLKVTIIIPHRINENISNTLEEIYKSDYNQDNIEIFQAEGTHPTVQRNECIKLSSGDIIYFIDNDSIIDINNIKNAIKIFEENKNVAIVGGPAIHIVSTEKERYIDKTMRSYYAVGPIAKRYSISKSHYREGSDKDVILCNLFIRREVLLEVGLFNENLYPNEENELIDKILSLGYKLMYDPEIVVKRPPRKNLKEYIKMLINYGRGRFEQLYINFNFKNLIFTIPAIFSIYILSIPIMSILYFLIKNNIILLYFIPIVIYSISTIFSAILYSLKESGIKNKIKGIFIYPFMFFITHFFYGFGFFFAIGRIIITPKKNIKFKIIKYKNLN